MEHPMITRINLTGYLDEFQRVYGNDALGNEVYVGDEILVFDDEYFLVEELSSDAKEILEMFGAGYEIAE